MGCINGTLRARRPATQVGTAELQRSRRVPPGTGQDDIIDIQLLRAATEDDTPDLKFTSTLAKCVAVYDGDTVTLAAPLSDGDPRLYKVRARLKGIDTPELRTRDLDEKTAGLKARDELRSLLLGQLVHVTWHGRGKYGREIVSLRTRSGVFVSEWMIVRGYARKYDGGKRLPYAQWGGQPAT